MLGLFLVVMAVCVAGIVGQMPSPCVTPPQFTGRARQFDHVSNQINRFAIVYDAYNKRRVLIEEQNAYLPGRQFFEFLTLGKENVEYEINLTLKRCTKSVMRHPWRPYGIPANSTFENEFYIGGPGEEILAQEWSDRIPYRKREYWVGVFSLNTCYPISEVIIEDSQQFNSTITTSFFDIVGGVINPDVFIPPPECQQAKWAPPSRMGPFL